MPAPDPTSRAIEQLRAAAGDLSRAAVTRIEHDRPWFRNLRAEERAWVGQIVQSGVRGFLDWLGAEGEVALPREEDLVVSLFGTVPQALAGVIDLRQTVDLIRLTIDEAERQIDQILDPEITPELHAGILRYGREVAFATAEVYARAAEMRGAWDARLEALVVDSVLRAESDDAILSRASAVGWAARGEVAVVVGRATPDQAEVGDFDEVRRAARNAGLDALCAVQGHLLVVILGGVTDPEKAAASVVRGYDEGPVVVGPVATDLAHAHVSASSALAGLRAVTGWPDAPRPVCSHDLLPERILAGDEDARREAIDAVYAPIAAGRGSLVETLTTYFSHGQTIEATARALFVHPNTVRYRLGQIAELTGFTPNRARDALVLQIALMLGRQDAAQGI
ncbi:PucR family transcriptional regulator [Nocardioides sp. GY 10113]|uniref:PucR family transcriptional regulator n=1 Tax=Nocardioides sp. GY 10113 TaxID=2569761 RepID=UPI0010A79F31|nr:helix-turn-helix domain-containing protein [Nocardioides sp. GY 10113]TIC83814.1 PucR family transcriptional regulator [Nocardioides sp. GY 10113]